MDAVKPNLIGRLGNQMFIYAAARGLAETLGFELHCEHWVGERVFTLDEKDHLRPNGHETVVLDGYFQAQKDLIYTREDCRRWFTFRPEVAAALEMEGYPYHGTHAHFRRGDYGGAGYPLIGYGSVTKALDQLGMDPSFIAITDENLEDHSEGKMLGDFYRLMCAPILFRANSSFSYWAAVLSTGRIFSPVITGLRGGVVHEDVPYVEGNWPRLCELEFVTNLHLKEK